MKTALLATLAALALSIGFLGAAPLAGAATLQKGEAQKGDVKKDANYQDAKKTGEEDKQAVIDAQLPSYPGNYCLAHGGKFTAEQPAQNLVFDGQLYRVCSERCALKVELDRETYHQRLRKTIIGAQRDSWPLKTCPISGDAYGGDHGTPVDHVIGTRYAKLCCSGCVKEADADPAKFLAKLDTLMLPELLKTYPSEACVISGEKLGSMGEPIDFMYGHRAVRLCCKGCVKSFKADPRKHMEALYPRKKGGKAAGKGQPQKKAPEKGGK